MTLRSPPGPDRGDVQLAGHCRNAVRRALPAPRYRAPRACPTRANGGRSGYRETLSHFLPGGFVQLVPFRAMLLKGVLVVGVAALGLAAGTDCRSRDRSARVLRRPVPDRERGD